MVSAPKPVLCLQQGLILDSAALRIRTDQRRIARRRGYCEGGGRRSISATVSRRLSQCEDVEDVKRARRIRLPVGPSGIGNR